MFLALNGPIFFRDPAEPAFDSLFFYDAELLNRAGRNQLIRQGVPFTAWTVEFVIYITVLT